MKLSETSSTGAATPSVSLPIRQRATSPACRPVEDSLVKGRVDVALDGRLPITCEEFRRAFPDRHR